MGDLTLRVLVSATTPDLASCRAAVKEELLTAGILPITQENFGPDYRSLKEFLQHEISKCDAVICLVGFVFGAAPLDNLERKRSYTQLEYDYAIQQKKPVFVFLSDETYIPATLAPEGGTEKELQRRHRESLMAAGHKCEFFSDANDLKVKVARAIHKLYHPPARRPMFYLHLPRRPSYFTGRGKEVQQLNEALVRTTPAIIVVIGMGGQGKTTLVHKVLLDLSPLPFAAGFWCMAYRGGFTFDMFLDEALRYLLNGKFDKREMPDVSVRVTRLLGLIQKQPVLLVIDGMERWLRGWNSTRLDLQTVETVHQRTGFHVGLDEFLQGASGLANGTHLVLTSRALPAALDQVERTHIPVREEDGESLCLEGLEPEASVELLRKLGVKGAFDELKVVADSYANHPLALTVLGSLLVKKYGGELSRFSRATAMAPSHELHRLLDEVRANLPGRERAERFLKVASHCIENPSLKVISAAMPAGEAGGVDDLRETAVMLADWNLVWWNGTTETVSLHPLVKSYFASLLDEAQSRRTHERLSVWYGALPIDENTTSLEKMSPRLLATKHAARAGRLDRAADLMFASMTEGCSLFTWLGRWGHQFAGIELLGELGSAAADELRGIFLLSQAQLYEHLARPQLAIEQITEAIALFVKHTRRGSQETRANLAKALATRGNIHREYGRSTDAILDYDRAIEIFKAAEDEFIGVKVDLARTLVNRGSAYHGIGELSRAILEYDRAYAIWKKLPAENVEPTTSSLAPLLTNRGIVLLDLGKVDQAIADFEEAVAICKEHGNYKNQDVIRHLAHANSMLGVALWKSRQEEKALPWASEAVAALQTLVDSGRKDCEHILAMSLINRAKVHMVLRQWREALSDCDRSVFIYRCLIAEAGTHFSAALAHAECTRAAVRHELGDWKGSEEDRHEGFATLKRLIHEWGCESEIRTAFLRDSVRALMYLSTTASSEAAGILEALLEDCERAFSAEESAEAFRAEARRAISTLETLIPQLEAAGYTTSRVKMLTEKAKLLE